MSYHKNLKDIHQNIQSILVSKKDHPTLKDAVKHLEKIGVNLPNLHKAVHETQNYFRFRQFEPSDKKQYTTQKLKGNDLAIIEKTDSRGNKWTPNYVDMGTYTIDTNQPNYHVPNKIMQQNYSQKNMQPIGGNPNTWTPKNLPQAQPRSSIVSVPQRQPIGGNPNTWTPKNLPQTNK